MKSARALHFASRSQSRQTFALLVAAENLSGSEGRLAEITAPEGERTEAADDVLDAALLSCTISGADRTACRQRCEVFADAQLQAMTMLVQEGIKKQSKTATALGCSRLTRESTD